MARKILTHDNIAMVDYKAPIIKDNTILDSIEYLGSNGSIAMFSFDPDNVTPQENAEIYKQRVWDLTDSKDLADMKEFVKGVDLIKRKVGEFHNLLAGYDLYVILQGIVTKDKDILKKLSDIQAAKDAWFASVGLVDSSIMN